MWLPMLFIMRGLRIPLHHSSQHLYSIKPHQPEDAPPPTVTPHTMRGASLGTTSRFQDFMPILRTEGGSARTWLLPHFKLPAITTFHQRGSSGSSNSTPNN
ncbi:hypothetical protein PIB30_046780 [Stylosanthes scabra]|uniref:Uncharacterized protein n=1 Tax=Stylosanthes scabra TaxID=79078 RepID=A0ABU6XEZ4_9FABA|nr:hypothetical protein [Stylosanthes scabra]